MSTFVLIHGSWHAAWCWARVSALLERVGHQVIAPDLPGHGADTTPLSARPYEMYVPKVCEALERLDEPAILLGHSSGGIIITEAARRRSDRIKSVVYLSAFLLPPGRTPREVMERDGESILHSCVEVDRDRGVSIVKPDCAKNVFYEDCNNTDTQWAISRLQPEPLIPPGRSAPADLASEPPTRVPRFYIECLRDKALGPSAQRWMYTECPCDAVYSLSTSHSPFLSDPQGLSECLLNIENRVANSQGSLCL